MDNLCLPVTFTQMISRMWAFPLSIFSFGFWTFELWIYEFCVGKYSFEIRCCSSCGSASIDIFIDIEFITMKWHFGLRAKFISIFTIMFEFIILTISLAFCPPSPLLGFKYFKTNPNTDNTDTKRVKNVIFEGNCLLLSEWINISSGDWEGVGGVHLHNFNWLLGCPRAPNPAAESLPTPSRLSQEALPLTSEVLLSPSTYALLS